MLRYQWVRRKQKSGDDWVGETVGLRGFGAGVACAIIFGDSYISPFSP